MKIFIDSDNIEEIKKYLSWGVCDGVTTNPTTFFRSGVSGAEGIKNRVLEISKLIGSQPLSVEVTSEIPEEIIKQAKEYSGWANNIVIKIPVTDSKGNSLLGVVKKLVQEGVVVNVTLIMNFNQAILAAKSISSGLEKLNDKKAHFISIFAGRITEEQGVERAFQVIKEARLWLDFHKFNNVEIIIASIRNPENIEYFSKTGGHVMTIPPEAISKSLLAARTKEGVAKFMEDAKKSI